jgi:hypothetical protein
LNRPDDTNFIAYSMLQPKSGKGDVIGDGEKILI